MIDEDDVWWWMINYVWWWCINVKITHDDGWWMMIDEWWMMEYDGWYMMDVGFMTMIMIDDRNDVWCMTDYEW